MFSYFSIFYFVTNGKTFGKMLVGLTVHSSSEEMTLIESMKRSIAYIICAMTGSFLFAIPYFRKDKRSLADIFSGTSVSVDSEKLNVQLEATIPAEQFEEDEAA
jgi:uncharacterized RDD family membrane protein YckC